ncbi:MAG: TIGR00304 family membrane protein [Candidatus Nanopusillus sp.]
MSNNIFLILAIIFLFISIILLFIYLLSNSSNTKFAGLILIGPIPILISNSYQLSIILLITLIIILIILIIFFYKIVI